MYKITKTAINNIPNFSTYRGLIRYCKSIICTLETISKIGGVNYKCFEYLQNKINYTYYTQASHFVPSLENIIPLETRYNTYKFFVNQFGNMYTLNYLISQGFSVGTFFVNDTRISTRNLEYDLNKQYFRTYHGYELISLMNTSDIQIVRIGESIYTPLG